MNLFGTIFWNFYATCYDTIAYLNPYGDMLDRVIRAANPSNGCRILDAGCGTGNLEKRLLDLYPGLRLEALDFSRAMVSRARRKTSALSVRIQEFDLDEPLPFEAHSFDAVISINCLYAVPRPEMTLGEIYRVLKPGGRLVIAELKADANMWIIFAEHLRGGLKQGAAGWPALMRTMLLRMPQWLLFGILNMAIYSRARRGNYTFRTAEEWKDLLSRLKFVNAEAGPVYAGQANLVFAIRSPDWP